MKDLVISHSIVEAKFLCTGDYFYSGDSPYPWLAHQNPLGSSKIKATQEIFVANHQVSKVRYFAPDEAVYILFPPRIKK